MYAVLREDAFLGETHIVTGSGQGIGFAVATLLAQHGAQVAMVDLDPNRLQEAAAEITSENAAAPLVVPADVSQEADVQKAVAQVLEIRPRENASHVVLRGHIREKGSDIVFEEKRPDFSHQARHEGVPRVTIYESELSGLVVDVKTSDRVTQRVFQNKEVETHEF